MTHEDGVSEVYLDGAHQFLNLPVEIDKCLCDPFDYLIVLRDGTQFQFGVAELTGNGNWLHLRDVTKGPPGLDFNRGVSIRLSEIAWVVDAPNGS